MDENICNCVLCRGHRLIKQAMDTIEEIPEVGCDYFDEDIIKAFNLLDDASAHWEVDCHSELTPFDWDNFAERFGERYKIFCDHVVRSIEFLHWFMGEGRDQVYQEFADSLDLTVDQLDKEQKQQALLNHILEEAENERQK